MNIFLFCLFLDIKIVRIDCQSVTSVYHKPIFSGFFMNFESLMPKSFKFVLILTLIHRAFKTTYLNVANLVRSHYNYKYVNADLKICQYLRLNIKVTVKNFAFKHLLRFEICERVKCLFTNIQKQ